MPASWLAWCLHGRYGVGDSYHECEDEVQHFAEWSQWRFGKTDDWSCFTISFGLFEEEVDVWQRCSTVECPFLLLLEVRVAQCYASCNARCMLTDSGQKISGLDMVS